MEKLSIKTSSLVDHSLELCSEAPTLAVAGISAGMINFTFPIIKFLLPKTDSQR